MGPENLRTSVLNSPYYCVILIRKEYCPCITRIYICQYLTEDTFPLTVIISYFHTFPSLGQHGELDILKAEIHPTMNKNRLTHSFSSLTTYIHTHVRLYPLRSTHTQHIVAVAKINTVSTKKRHIICTEKGPVSRKCLLPSLLFFWSL